MDNNAKRMMELKKESYFEKDHFSHLIQLPGITYFSSNDFVDFKSRESTYKHLLEAIKDGKNKVIGLCGMGGSGKTTLAKEVGKEVDKLKIFEKVIMVIVSKPLNVTKVQQDIAEQIDLKFSEETPLARAQRLSNGLKNKKILIILDDVWEYLKFEDIGIPLVEGCQILLTTRLRNVCGSMGCETIELPLITREEAWELFKKHANLCSDSSNMFDDIGRKIVNECKELPIAIVTVGRSLKKKPIRAWESTLRRLQRSQPLNVEEGLTNVNACLELSYDGLSSSIAKSLFLLCSMFPEDHEIHREDLIRFGKRTLELEESIVTMKDVRGEILDALDILLDSCLLMSIEKEAYVKMHDLVRDVALWIAKKQRQAILVDDQAISSMFIDSYQSLKDTKAVSLWNLNMDFELYKQLHCPKLEILLLQPHGFIASIGAIESLKVLALITDGFKWSRRGSTFRSITIPQSIVSLTNLHTLCFRGKKLGDISFLCEFKRLEILDLHSSLFDELPTGIAYMKMLRLLDIFRCQIKKSPLEVIGRCEQLEELYFWDNKYGVPKNVFLSGLKRYVLYDSTCSIIGAYGNDPFPESLDSCGEELRALSIQGFRVSTLNSSMKDLILRANHLWLDNSSPCPSLETIRIHNCFEFERLIDEEVAHGDPLLHDMQDYQQEHENDTVSVVKSELCFMWLAYLPELEYIWKDPIQILSLHRLESIKLWGCPRLRNMFILAIVTSLPELRYLDVIRCNEWEGRFCEESLKNLSTTSTVCFPKLESIRIIDCHKVRRVFSYSLASHCPSLEKITIRNCSQLERVVEAYEGEVAAHHQRLFPKLNYLSLWNLPKLREIYEGYEFSHLSATIRIEDCPNISKISKIPLEDKPSSSGS
ncbi:disease resistance protein At4g27190-like [Neltuma alba]|uniref:disease resistance protein At4g27190-like n=1 Tax=Neltuma alba TaxID=207710 RepID=UPI0010A553E3|nr:disease resistance protein At4g27190-like [Prosopis alba]